MNCVDVPMLQETMITMPLNSDSLAVAEGKRLENISASLKSPGKGEKLASAARQFEEFMLGNVYKTMYQSAPKSGFMENSFARDVFMGMYIDEVVKQGKMGDKGIASLIMKEYSKHEKPDFDPKITDEIRSTTADPYTRLDDKLERLAFGDFGAHGKRTLTELAELSEMLSGRMTSDYGMRLHPIRKVERFHHGIDYGLKMGRELQAPSGGKVVFAGPKGGYGNTVVIDHGEGITSLYAHLSEINVKEGEYISKNNILGKIGSTGVSTGPHLHFEVRHNDNPIDPNKLAVGKKMAKAF